MVKVVKRNAGQGEFESESFGNYASEYSIEEMLQEGGLVKVTAWVRSDMGFATNDVRVTVFSASFLIAQGMNGAGLAGSLGPMSFFYPTAFQASSAVNSLLTFSAQSTNNPATAAQSPLA